MGEGGVEPTEVGKELAEHAKHAQSHEPTSRHDRTVSIIEAMLLAVVAVLAAWSGFASAKWGTESRLRLAQASTARTQASSATLAAMDTRNFDASTFNAWFTAYTAGNTSATAIAERRFRPEFKVAFDAWIATDPSTNPDAPPGPTYMPEYREPDAIRAGHGSTPRPTRLAAGGRRGRRPCRRLRPHHRVPGHRAVPRRASAGTSASRRPASGSSSWAPASSSGPRCSSSPRSPPPPDPRPTVVRSTGGGRAAVVVES